MSNRRQATPAAPPRRRLTRDDRNRQLLGAARALIRAEGSDALSLGRLAEVAGVTKPVVYDHFGTRAGLLLALYEEFDARQTQLMDEALRQSGATLPQRANVIAASYVACVIEQGRELPGVMAALAGSPELDEVRRDWEARFIHTCRDALAPFTDGELGSPALRAMRGAAEALSYAAAHGEITAAQAEEELTAVIVSMVERRRAR